MNGIDFSKFQEYSAEESGIDFSKFQEYSSDELPEDAPVDTDKPITYGTLLDDTLDEQKEYNALMLKKLQEAREKQNEDLAMTIKAKKKAKNKEYLLEIEDLRSRMPSTLERVTTEVSDFGSALHESVASLNQLIYQPIGSGLEKAGEYVDSPWLEEFGQEVKKGMQEWLETQKKEVEEDKQRHAETYGREAYTVGSSVGEVTAEFLGGAGAKTVTSLAGREAILASAREEVFADDKTPLVPKLMAISADVTMSIVGGHILKGIFPKSQTEELNEMTGSIRDPKKRQEIQESLDAIEDAGIQTLDYDARSRIFDKVTEGKIIDSMELGDIIRKEVEVAKKLSLDIRDALYAAADLKGSASTKFNLTGERSIRLGEFGKDKDWGVDENKEMFETFKASMQKMTGKTAADLEALRKSYVGKAGDTTNDNLQRLYTKLADHIGDESDRLFPSGVNPYKQARSAHSEYVNKFKSGATGFDAETAKKFEAMLKTPSANKEVERLFTSKVDPDVVDSYKNIVKGDQKTLDSTFWNLVTNNVRDPKSQDGIEEMLNNFYSMDIKGLEKLLGVKGYKKVTTNMAALGMIKEAIDKAEAKNKGLLKDVLDFSSSAAMYNISPYTSTRIAISSGGKILSKTIKAERSAYAKKISSLKMTPPLRQALQGLMLTQIEDIQLHGGAEAGEVEEVPDATLKIEKKVGSTVDSLALQVDDLLLEDEGEFGDTTGVAETGLRGMTTATAKLVRAKYKKTHPNATEDEVRQLYIKDGYNVLDKKIKGFSRLPDAVKIDILKEGYNLNYYSMPKWSGFNIAIGKGKPEQIFKALLDTAQTENKASLGIAKRRARTYNKHSDDKITEVETKKNGETVYYKGSKVFLKFKPKKGLHPSSSAKRVTP